MIFQLCRTNNKTGYRWIRRETTGDHGRPQMPVTAHRLWPWIGHLAFCKHRQDHLKLRLYWENWKRKILDILKIIVAMRVSITSCICENATKYVWINLAIYTQHIHIQYAVSCWGAKPQRNIGPGPEGPKTNGPRDQMAERSKGQGTRRPRDHMVKGSWGQ